MYRPRPVRETFSSRRVDPDAGEKVAEAQPPLTLKRRAACSVCREVPFRYHVPVRDQAGDSPGVRPVIGH